MDQPASLPTDPGARPPVQTNEPTTLAALRDDQFPGDQFSGGRAAAAAELARRTAPLGTDRAVRWWQHHVADALVQASAALTGPPPYRYPLPSPAPLPTPLPSQPSAPPNSAPLPAQRPPQPSAPPNSAPPPTRRGA